VQRGPAAESDGRWRWEAVILMGLPIAQMLEDLLIVGVGPIFLSAVKLTLFVGGLVMLKHCHPHVVARSRIASPFLATFLLFGALQAASVLYAGHLHMSEKVNYFLYHGAGLAIAYGLARALVIGGYAGFVGRFRRALRLIFYSSLLLATAQLLLRDQILRNVGGFPGQLPTYVVGFNWERLFLCEFLTLGLASGLMERGHMLRKAALAAWTFVIVLASGSTTGLLGLGLVALVTRRVRFHSMVTLGALGAMMYLLVVPAVRTHVFTPNELEREGYRYEANIGNYEENNWRYWSTARLVVEGLHRPTMFGQGYKENEEFLSEPYAEFYLNKHGRQDREQRHMSSHTIVSVMYDQGIVGIVVVTTVLCMAGVYCLRLLSFRTVDAQTHALVRLAVILTGLMLLRMVFYYHSLYRWHFLVAAAFLNAAWYVSRRDQARAAGLRVPLHRRIRKRV
jgi:hypothetical protein